MEGGSIVAIVLGSIAILVVSIMIYVIYNRNISRRKDKLVFSDDKKI